MWEQLQFAGKYFSVDQSVLNYFPQHADRVAPSFASLDGGRYRPMQRVNHCADTASVVVAI